MSFFLPAKTYIYVSLYLYLKYDVQKVTPVFCGSSFRSRILGV